MGTLLDCLEARAPCGEPARYVYGVTVAFGLPLVWGVLGRCLTSVAPWWLEAVALNSTFAGRSLLEAARRVEDDLGIGDVDRARADLRWLVSRPTDNLDRGLIASAAIESLAENFVDSWLAPLAAYSVFGLGGALAYRAANTADAMWGYRSADYEWLGKGAARLDDVLNWLPARLGGLLLVIAGPRPRAALAVWLRDARLTASPNAGHSMATVAGHLGVRLEKSGHYVLHANGRVPSSSDLGPARQLVRRAMLLAAALCLIARKMVRP
jgi:adenosylcobinamide-phosphate synthase